MVILLGRGLKIDCMVLYIFLANLEWVRLNLFVFFCRLGCFILLMNRLLLVKMVYGFLYLLCSR